MKIYFAPQAKKDLSRLDKTMTLVSRVNIIS